VLNIMRTNLKVMKVRIMKFTINNRLELLDWLSNNMNWCDVENEAERVEKEKIDKASEFVNAKKEYITA